MKAVTKLDRRWYCMVVILSCLMTMLTSTTGLQCSCYTFYSNITKRDWDISRKECKANGGDLVAMEQETEWEFIKTQIQTRTTSSGYNQWWIGLTREGGVWKWINGDNLTYSRWKEGLDVFSNARSHAIIENIQGTMWNTYWYNDMGSICENEGAVLNTDCEARQVKWCDITSTSVTTVRDHTTVRQFKNQTSRNVVTTISEDPTAGPTTRPVVVNSTSSAKADDKKLPSNSKLMGSMLVVIGIVVVIVLAIVGIVVVVICTCRRNDNDRDRPKEKREDNNTTGTEKTTQDTVYATVSETKETTATTTVPEYAVVKKPPKKRQDELNYAVLSDFTNDAPHDVVKPPEYQETEYAVLDVT